MKWLKQRRFQWLALGAFLSLGAPGGLWLLQTMLPSTTSFFWVAFIYSAVATLIFFSLFGYASGWFMDRLEFLAFHDTLTRLYNRRYLLQQLQETIALSHRYHQSFSLIMLDLDYFKKVNDRFGHAVGDQTLRAVSQVIRQMCRNTDIPARYGGEEFLIVCPNTANKESHHLAERIRQKVAELSISELGFPGPQTISLGVLSSSEQKIPLDTLLQKVDEAMYQAKHQGRNQVVIGTLTTPTLSPLEKKDSR